jgi:hypothetical protein
MQWHVFNQRILGLVRPSTALAATSHCDNGQPLFPQTGCFCSLLATFFGPRDELLARALRASRAIVSVSRLRRKLPSSP